MTMGVHDKHCSIFFFLPPLHPCYTLKTTKTVCQQVFRSNTPEDCFHTICTAHNKCNSMSQREASFWAVRERHPHHCRQQQHSLLYLIRKGWNNRWNLFTHVTKLPSYATFGPNWTPSSDGLTLQAKQEVTDLTVSTLTLKHKHSSVTKRLHNHWIMHHERL